MPNSSPSRPSGSDVQDIGGLYRSLVHSIPLHQAHLPGRHVSEPPSRSLWLGTGREVPEQLKGSPRCAGKGASMHSHSCVPCAPCLSSSATTNERAACGVGNHDHLTSKEMDVQVLQATVHCSIVTRSSILPERTVGHVLLRTRSAFLLLRGNVRPKVTVRAIADEDQCNRVGTRPRTIMNRWSSASEKLPLAVLNGSTSVRGTRREPIDLPFDPECPSDYAIGDLLIPKENRSRSFPVEDRQLPNTSWRERPLAPSSSGRGPGPRDFVWKKSSRRHFMSTTVASGATAPAQKYKYYLLSDAVRMARPVYPNVYGVIAEFCQPKPTKGTDYVMNVKLLDPSCNGQEKIEDGVEVLFFASSLEFLPKPRKAAGEIIRLHRVQVTSYEDKPQFICKVGPGCHVSFLLFEGSLDGSEHPYHTSTARYSLDAERESGILKFIREWANNRERPLSIAKYSRRLFELKSGEGSCDIICKVIQVNKRKRENGQEDVLVYVWDGTDCIPQPLRTDTAVAVLENAAGLATELAERWSPLQLSRKEIKDLDVPRIGSLLPVFFWSYLGSSIPQEGDSIRLKNVITWVHNGQLCGLLSSHSNWSYHEATYMEEYSNRTLNNHVAQWAPEHSQDLLTTTEFEHIPWSTLREVIADEKPGRYRILVQIIGYLPHDYNDWCTKVGNREGEFPPSLLLSIGASPKAEWVFSSKFLLRDATGTIEALLTGRSAEQFFPGLPALDPTKNNIWKHTLDTRMQHLLGENTTQEAGEWIQCCVEGYHTNIGSPEQTRRYRIFATMMKPIRVHQDMQAGSGV